MRSIAKVLAILPLWVASQTLSQSTAKIQQKIVFVRPDPIIVGSSAVSHLSADPVGGAFILKKIQRRRFTPRQTQE